MSETTCEWCQAEIGPEDELYEFDGCDFCSDSCAEMYEEQHQDDGEWELHK